MCFVSSSPLTHQPFSLCISGINAQLTPTFSQANGTSSQVLSLSKHANPSTSVVEPSSAVVSHSASKPTVTTTHSMIVSTVSRHHSVMPTGMANHSTPHTNHSAVAPTATTNHSVVPTATTNHSAVMPSATANVSMPITPVHHPSTTYVVHSSSPMPHPTHPGKLRVVCYRFIKFCDVTNTASSASCVISVTTISQKKVFTNPSDKST